jgi:hypothetical protein
MIEEDDYIIDDEIMEMLVFSFDDFTTDLLEEHPGEFNVLDISAIVLSRLCRYSIEGGYSDQFKDLLQTASDSLDRYDTQELLGSNTLQ